MSTTTTGLLQHPFTLTVPFQEGTDFHRLVQLSDICANLIDNNNNKRNTSTSDGPVISARPDTTTEIQSQLQELDNQEPQWSLSTIAIAYVLCSAAFVSQLQGSWLDIGLGLLGGTLSFTVVTAFGRYWPDRTHTFGKLLAAFLPAVAITGVAMATSSSVNINAAIIGSIISEVPGFGITKGTFELAQNRILAGLGHWIAAFLTCAWLALGMVGGVFLVLTLAGQDTEDLDIDSTPIDRLWYILMGPILGVCFSISFHVGQRELPFSILVCLVAFGMNLTIEHYHNENVGTVVAAFFVTTLTAQIWSRSWHHRLMILGKNNKETTPYPSTIVLMPAFFILVGGSIGVRGFAAIFTGNEDDGESTLWNFILVPILLVFGIYLGISTIPSVSVF